MPAVCTLYPCETTMQIATIQITLDDIHDMGTPESKTRGILVVPNLFQFFEMRCDAFVVVTGAWVARAIDVAGREIGDWLSHE